jgi:hypothetical protein
MNAAADREHSFVRCGHRARFVWFDGPRIGEPQVRPANLLEVADVVGGAHDRGGCAMALGGAADVDELDPVARRGDELEVGRDGVG